MGIIIPDTAIYCDDNDIGSKKAETNKKLYLCEKNIYMEVEEPLFEYISPAYQSKMMCGESKL
jgi:hypothetical protein